MTVLRVNTIAGIGTTTFGPTFGGNLEFNSQNYIVLPKGSSTQQGVLRETVDVVGTGGTFYDNLVLAMPFNEATGLRDVSSRNRNPGTGGDVGIGTTVSKYYGSSVKFDGSGDYLAVRSGPLGNGEAVGVGTTTGSLDFQFRTGDFTIEFWMNRFDTGTNVGLMDSRPNSSDSNGWFIKFNSATSIQFTETGKTYNTSSFTANQWTHIAFCRGSDTLFSFVDGVGVSTSLSSKDFSNANFLIGGFVDTQSSPNAYGGYLQDLRVYKGLAKYTANFTPPDRIAEIGVGFTTGQLRYNTDSNLPELYDGNQWVQLSVSQVGLGTGGDTEPGARGLIGGGYDGTSPSAAGRVNIIDYITISSTGNAIDFGDLTVRRSDLAALSSSTRGVFGGGFDEVTPVYQNTIDYITVSSTGNALDFGDLTQSRTSSPGGCSSSTRGVFAAGYANAPTVPVAAIVNTIDYVTIASTGNAVDFGDTTVARSYIAGFSSPTRGVFGGGHTPTKQNVVDYVTLSTLGNAFDFGDLTVARSGLGACATSSRGVFAGGEAPTASNVIDFITISTLGNAVKFGDLLAGRVYVSGCASPTRGVFAGGGTPTRDNVMQYISITTAGNAVDFGDLSVGVREATAATSNAHGGL